MKVYLTALLKAKKENAPVLKAVLENMVLNSRKEKACLQYDLFETDDAQTFIFHEIWETQKGLDLHNNMPYITEFRNKHSELANEIIIYKTNKIA
ncbi:putative quinol monooxygenase [Pedobacter aquatilis]|uniref:putative quinol monooxygenase n=1 Tax=Pedobacter aquatilis TaxID=351343 RepID=UPI00292DF31D|nr:antibiotic biosynthesis monooxygenase [Pedobacter aquatilis]